MAIKSGKSGQITPRDIELMRALAFCPLLNARQIMKLDLPGPEYTNYAHLISMERENKLSLAERGFSNYERCRKSLYRLAKKGFLSRYTTTNSGLTMWLLTQEGYRDVVHDRLWLESTHGIFLPYNDYKPDPSRVDHYTAVCDLFVGLQPALNRYYGPMPIWDWVSERRAFASYSIGKNEYRYMPDAEVILGDEDIVYVIERQTRNARKTEADIRLKIEQHHNRLTGGSRSLPEDQFQILFACDERRDVDYAMKAARSLGLGHLVVADEPWIIVQYIRESASIHSKYMEQVSAPTPDREPVGSSGIRAEDQTTKSSQTGDLDDFDLDQFEEVPF